MHRDGCPLSGSYRLFQFHHANRHANRYGGTDANHTRRIDDTRGRRHRDLDSDADANPVNADADRCAANRGLHDNATAANAETS